MAVARTYPEQKPDCTLDKMFKITESESAACGQISPKA